MKKLFMLLTCTGLVACSPSVPVIEDHMPELTVAHLSPITVCGDRKRMDVDLEITPRMNLLLRDWYTDVLTLNRDCKEREVVFKIQNFDFKETHDEEKHETTYTQTVSAKVGVNNYTGEIAKATTDETTSITFDSYASLAEKEAYRFQLNEKSLNEFDRSIRKGINRYLESSNF